MGKEMKISPKLIMYAGIGFLTPLLPSLESLTPEKMAGMCWPQWLVIGLAPILSVLVTLKALASTPDVKDAP